jgi:hypothetical protein
MCSAVIIVTFLTSDGQAETVMFMVYEDDVDSFCCKTLFTHLYSG